MGSFISVHFIRYSTSPVHVFKHVMTNFSFVLFVMTFIRTIGPRTRATDFLK
jgi:hypothetical protein